MSAVKPPRTCAIRTLGCQVNVHDSERPTGLPENAGYVLAAVVFEKAARAANTGDEGTDVVVVNTYSVREDAATRLFGNLGQLAAVKRERPGVQIAVGGCLAQQMHGGIIEKAPWVDAVLGTHNLDILPVPLEHARHNAETAAEIEESLKVFPSILPTRRESAFAAWVSISAGCSNTCAFCIVPHLRGKERDRRPGEVLAEVEAVVSEGAIEVTLLGQNVNSYGVGFGDRQAFVKLLRACGKIEGLEHVRFTSPCPAAFSDEVITAMAETPSVTPPLHMPLQSGSDRVLRAMCRSYRPSRFLSILDRICARMPEAVITIDVIVGSPGETDEDFEATLDVVERPRFASAYTFIYSPRPGTPAADMGDQVDPEVVSDRYRRLVVLQERISTEENKVEEGSAVEVPIFEGEGRKDAETERVNGRAVDNRLVHVALPAGIDAGDRLRPGDMVRAVVIHGAPHHLVADSVLAGGLFEVRRTRAGETWAAHWRRTEQLTAEAEGRAPVSLGMPTIRRRPAP